jgi:hypothetical protein
VGCKDNGSFKTLLKFVVGELGVGKVKFMRKTSYTESKDHQDRKRCSEHGNENTKSN